MIGARRLIGAGIAALALATGLGTAALVAPDAPAAASTVSATAVRNMPACETNQLAIWVNQHGRKTPTRFYLRLEFTNLTDHSCWMRGFPGVLAEGLHGKRLGDAAVRESGVRMVNAILPPHGTAHALLGYRYPLISQPACQAQWSSYLRVQEPESWGRRTFFVKKVCSVRNGLKDLTIRPIYPGL